MRNESLADFLRRNEADADTVQQAARYYLAQRLDDLPPEEMRSELEEAAHDPNAVARAVGSLSQDAFELENAALVILSDAWDESQERPKVERAIHEAKGKLPVIEIGMLAIVIMYGMYLRTTGGVKRAKTTVQRAPDGTLTTTTEREFSSFNAAAGAIAKLFTS